MRGEKGEDEKDSVEEKNREKKDGEKKDGGALGRHSPPARAETAS
jgi:hypothetical protein